MNENRRIWAEVGGAKRTTQYHRCKRAICIWDGIETAALYRDKVRIAYHVHEHIEY